MAPCRVKDAPLAGFAHPRVRLRALVVAAFGENDAIGVVLRVDVGFVPAFNWRQPFQHRMTRVDDGFLENTGSVAFELPADQFDVFW